MPSLSDQLSKRIAKRAVAIWPELQEKLPSVKVERPADPKNGDLATTLPLQLAGILKRSPLEIAEKLKQTGLSLPALEEPVVAAPGFLNFSLKKSWLAKQPKRILASGSNYGRSEIAKRERIHLEFISANPTGPLTLGNGRGGFTGDVLGNVLSMSGARVHREYYVNDVGKQVETLAESIVRRYFQLQGIPVEYPEYCYQGAYVTELAKTLPLEGVSLTHIEKAKARIQGQAIRRMLSGIKQLTRRVMKVRFDRFFLESELYRKKIDQRMLKLLRERDLAYEKEGALWMKTSDYGDDKDRVLIKANGEKTYFLSDVAYLWEKFALRRFDRAILLLGADHHGYVNRMQAVTQALGWPGRLEVNIFQLVRLMDQGKEVRMSKRSGTFVTLDELIHDVGLDVARFFFLMVGPGTHMDFDLQLAKEHSEKNPVYYVQYAHARIVSLLKKAKPLLRKKQVARKAPVTDPSAFTLVKTLLEFPELVERSARTRNVSELPPYTIRLATDFHTFYTKVRIINDGVVQLPALELAQATQLVLAQSLNLLGVRAPEKM